MTPNQQEETKVDFWDKEDAEYLQHQNKDEAIEHIIDNEGSPFPETIEVIGYARQVAKLKDFNKERILERLYEDLDEDYGSPDGEFCTPNQTVEDALDVFLKVLIENYKAWTCEEVIREKVNVKNWVTQNCPEWIEDGVTFEEDLSNEN